MSNNMIFSGVKDGDLFELAGIQFIKFPDEGGITPVVAKDLQFISSFGGNNNFAESKALRQLQEEWLPRVTQALGDESLCEICTDLTTLDGLKPYEPLRSLVSLPTLEFYRKHVEIFDRYSSNRWWWLATPESAQPHSEPDWTLCVTPSGDIDSYRCGYDFGVRPFLALKSFIFVSSET